MSTAPLTVIVLSHNHAHYVEQALDSVVAQGIAELRLIVNDDASQDDTPRRIRAWAERMGVDATLVLRERNVGLPRSLNEALEQVTTPFYCTISADDYYLPGGLAALLGSMLEQPDDVAVAYGDVQDVAPDGTVLFPSHLERVLPDGRRPDGWVFDDVHRICFLSVMATVVRTSAARAAGGYDESLRFEDWDLWLRLATCHRFVHVPAVVAGWRELPTSMFHAQFASTEYQREIVQMMHGWLDRDETARRHSAFWMRRAARLIARTDRREARELLLSVADVPPIDPDEPDWNRLATLLAVPASGRVLPHAERAHATGRRLWHAERQAWRDGRRLSRAGRPL